MALSNIEKNNYIYPDGEETITLKLIGETEPYENYWEKSEEEVLNRVIKSIKKKRLNGKFLDIGCGLGRLIHKFSPYFQEIYGVEPDKGRFDVCKKNISEWELEDKVKLFNGSVEAIEQKNSFDMILCSHVIQHIPEQTVIHLLEAIRTLIKKDGILVFTTAHSIIEKDIYVKSYMNCVNKRIEELISPEEFNGFENVEGLLPIKMFTLNSLNTLLKINSFDIIDSKVYHHNKASKLLDNALGTDKLINTCEYIKNRCGRDIFVIAKA